MKIYKNTTKRWLASISAVCLLSLLLSSCLKDSKSTYVQQPVAYLSITQASPDAPASSFYLDDNLVNNSPLSYGDEINYISVYTGKRTASFKSGSTLLASDTITFKNNDIFSLFLSNSISHPDFIFLKDTLNIPSGNTANIRFVNLSPDAPAVDLAITGGAVLVPNKAYKGHSSFAPIQGGSYNIEVRQKGTSTVLATLPAFYINSGFIYTIMLRGLLNGTGTTKLTIDTFNNLR